MTGLPRSTGWQLLALVAFLPFSWAACWHKTQSQGAAAAPASAPESAPVTKVDPAPTAPAPVSSAEPAELAARPAEPASVAPSTNVWAIPARDALLRAPCAKCHNGSLSTSLPAALAIYNLVEDPWYGRLKPHNYDGILRRVTNSTTIPEADKVAIVNFVHCSRDGVCAPAAGTQ
jgi:hypothetical protein